MTRRSKITFFIFQYPRLSPTSTTLCRPCGEFLRKCTKLQIDSGELQLWHTPSVWQGVLMSKRAALMGEAVLRARYEAIARSPLELAIRLETAQEQRAASGFCDVRICSDDIDAAVDALDFIGRACVLYNADKERITAFVTTDRPDLKLRDLNAALGDALVDYMLPRRLVVLEEMPLNANGKIDRPYLKTLL